MSLRPLYRPNNPGSIRSMVAQQKAGEAKAYIVVDGNRPDVDVEREILQLKGIESCLSELALRTTVRGSQRVDNSPFFELEDDNGRLPVIYDYDDISLLRSNL